jgi:hypothetical protein
VLERWAAARRCRPAASTSSTSTRNGHWFTYRIADGTRVNLTEKIDVRFQREQHARPSRAYGTAGWTANDGSVLLNDQFDMWEVQPDGKNARMVTGGEGARRNPEKVVMLDKAFGAVTKAKNADTVVFTLSRFEEFPDLWVSDLTFKDMKKVSTPTRSRPTITWGTSELITYINADGKTLRAILTKPDNFDPSKKYPVDGLHLRGADAGAPQLQSRHRVGHQHQHPRYVSNGYVVLQPDIVYETGYPGEAPRSASSRR